MSIFSAFKAVGDALKVLVVTEAVVELAGSDEEGQEGDVNKNNESGTIIEDIELEAKYLVNRVRELIREGNVRKLVVKDSKGKYLLEIPLGVGVLAGGVLAVTAPTWALLSAVAGFVANVRLEVTREVPAEPEGEEEAAESNPEKD